MCFTDNDGVLGLLISLKASASCFQLVLEAITSGEQPTLRPFNHYGLFRVARSKFNVQAFLSRVAPLLRQFEGSCGWLGEIDSWLAVLRCRFIPGVRGACLALGLRCLELDRSLQRARTPQCASVKRRRPCECNACVAFVLALALL